MLNIDENNDKSAASPNEIASDNKTTAESAKRASDAIRNPKYRLLLFSPLIFKGEYLYSFTAKITALNDKTIDPAEIKNVTEIATAIAIPVPNIATNAPAPLACAPIFCGKYTEA